MLQIPFGLHSLDSFLGGGLSPNTVTLVYGASNTGKTTLAMQLAINCIRKRSKALFVDCDNDFSVQRLKQMMTEDFEAINDLIILMKPKNFDKQVLLLGRLTDYLNKKFGIVIVDTITSLYLNEVSENPKKGFTLNRELNRQMAILAQASKIWKIPIVVTSQVSFTLDVNHSSFQPVATRVLHFWADTIIDIHQTDKPHLIKMKINKPKMNKSQVFYAKLNHKGIINH